MDAARTAGDTAFADTPNEGFDIIQAEMRYENTRRPFITEEGSERHKT